MDAKKKTITGILFVILFTILSAFQAVFLSNVLQHINVFVTLIFVFTFITLFFLSIQVYESRVHKKQPIKISGEVLWWSIVLNLTTAGSWFGYFIALKYIEPAIFSSVANSLGPLITLFLLWFLNRSNQRGIHTYVCSLGIFLSMLYVVYNAYIGNSGIIYFDKASLFLGLMMTFLCGISMSLNTIVSKKLNVLNVQPTQIMYIRFCLLIIISFFFVDIKIIFLTILTYYRELLFIAIMGNIVPLYSLQVGINKSDVFTVSIILVLAPIFVLIFQYLDSNIQFSHHLLVGILSITFFIIYSIFLNKNR